MTSSSSKWHQPPPNEVTYDITYFSNYDLTLRKGKAACEFSERKEKINHLLFIDDEIGEFHIIDLACPYDTRVKQKKQENVMQYQ